MTIKSNQSPVNQHIGGVFIIVNNMPRAVEWYRDILGLSADKEFINNSSPDIQTIYSLSMGKTALILDSIHRDTLNPSQNHLFFFDTDNIKETYEYMKKKNVNIASEIEGTNGVRFFEVIDPEGNKIMFCETE
jgi:predicted enzyme related to lactoylglutathione lyase